MKNWPSLVNDHQAIECYTNPEGDYSIYVVKRADGNFCTYEEELSEYDGQINWLPIGMSSSIYESKDELLKSIELNNPWVSRIEPKYNT